MRIHYLQHEPTEGLGFVEHWAIQHGHALSSTQLWNGESLPIQQNFEALLVFGGPMNIYEEDLFPWLIPEKKFIKAAIESGKKIIGFCLGSQLLADILGGPVTRNKFMEIGWFPIQWTDEALALPVLQGLPSSITVLHWHGDTFALPPGAMRLAESLGCENQGFVWGNNILAFQFHLEFTLGQVQQFLSTGDLPAGQYVQKPEAMLSHPDQFDMARTYLETILDRFLI